MFSFQVKKVQYARAIRDFGGSMDRGMWGLFKNELPKSS